MINKLISVIFQNICLTTLVLTHWCIIILERIFSHVEKLSLYLLQNKQNPDPSWISVRAWKEILALENIPAFVPLVAYFMRNPST
jgi:hypothetical protein